VYVEYIREYGGLDVFIYYEGYEVEEGKPDSGHYDAVVELKVKIMQVQLIRKHLYD
jgi:hypothetical protein